jgi:small subunit ribosomal protein S17
MAEEEKNQEQQEETQAEEQPQAEDDARARDSATRDTEQEPQAEEQPEEAAEAEDASSDGEAAAPEADRSDELEGLDWKARRRLERSRRPAERRPQQSPEERAAARREARKQAARRRASYRVKRRQKKEGGTGTPPAERRSAGRKVRQGRVVSSKPDKTITVQIEIARRHPQYEKIVRHSRTLHAHDARNEAGEGDLVRVVETRPLSRTKRWRLVEILEKAK